MPRKSETPLDPRGREVQLYRGDWDRLKDILAPKGISPSAYIRELVRLKLRKIESQAAPMEETDVEL